METWVRHLAAKARGVVRANAPLSEYTTWRIGGPADLLLEPADEEELAAVLDFCRQERIPLLIFGGGANLLCDDAGLRGVAVRMAEGLGQVTPEESARLHVGAGATVAEVARFCASQGLSGLEHAGNIPGSFGGLLAMNGGSHRKSIGDSVLHVSALDINGNRVALPHGDCGFGYRSSVFQKAGEDGLIITGALLQLHSDAPEAVHARMDKDLRERRAKFPLDMPSCGSVFKSLETLYEGFGPPGKVIEDAGLKGASVGGVRVSRRHANFFVNTGKGRSRDVLALIALVCEEVARRTGVRMECEVRYVSPHGVMAPAHEAAAGGVMLSRRAVI